MTTLSHVGAGGPGRIKDGLLLSETVQRMTR